LRRGSDRPGREAARHGRAARLDDDVPALTSGQACQTCLLGAPVPEGLAWDEITLAGKGTGRQLLSGLERDRLGPLAERFPLFT
jgi:hypothetical protein